MDKTVQPMVFQPPPLPQQMDTMAKSDFERLIRLETQFAYVAADLRREASEHAAALKALNKKLSAFTERKKKADEPLDAAGIVKLLLAIPLLSMAFSALLSGNQELALRLVKSLPVP